MSNATKNQPVSQVGLGGCGWLIAGCGVADLSRGMFSDSINRLAVKSSPSPARLDLLDIPGVEKQSLGVIHRDCRSCIFGQPRWPTSLGPLEAAIRDSLLF